MEIIVLLKQVPSTESVIEVADGGKTIKTDSLKWVINPYDELAVEEAIRIRDAQGGTVTIVAVGHDKAVEAIRTALAMGADKGVLINDPAIFSLDSLGVARVLAHAVKGMDFDLIIAGMRAVDDDSYIVGTAVAEFLNIANVSMVIRQEIKDGTIRCHRVVEGGTVVLETPLPALITTQRGLNEPRYASLPGIMKAKKKPLDTKNLGDLGMDSAALEDGATKIVSMQYPPERTGGKIIEADSDQSKAAELVRLLHEEARVV